MDFKPTQVPFFPFLLHRIMRVVKFMSLTQESAYQRTEYGSFVAMGSKNCGISGANEQNSEDIRFLHGP